MISCNYVGGFQEGWAQELSWEWSIDRDAGCSPFVLKRVMYKVGLPNYTFLSMESGPDD
jgi:hypothetical protein